MQVKIEKPILRIPMLAIHLNRDILSEGFKMNKQTHLVPVLASAVKKAVNKPAANGAQGTAAADGQNKRQKVDGAGDAADTTPRTVKVRRSIPAKSKQTIAASCHQDNCVVLSCLHACLGQVLHSCVFTTCGVETSQQMSYAALRMKLQSSSFVVCLYGVLLTDFFAWCCAV